MTKAFDTRKTLPGLRPLTRAVGLAVLAMGAGQTAWAGPGFVDAKRNDGSPFRLQTYFASSPSGIRQTPVAEGPADQNTGKALRKFVDPLPLIGAANAKTLSGDPSVSKYIPTAVTTKWVNPTGNITGDDYYEIAVVEYIEKLHSDLAKPTTLRGYVQIDPVASNSKGASTLPGSKAVPLTYPDGSAIMINGTDANGKLTGFKVQAMAVDTPHYLGPVINATKGVPTRVKFLNLLPTGHADVVANSSPAVITKRNGDLFLPVDKSLLGSGFGPDGITEYTQNRANLHLHGGDTPWISDGSAHQWVTAIDEADVTNPKSLAATFKNDPNRDPLLLPDFLRGVSTQNVPDMNDPGAGAQTYYYPNGQTARMLWVHDQSTGIARLNVYAGMAAPYFLTDPQEAALVANGTLPPAERTLPLILQDRMFVPKDISLQDGKWNTTAWGTEGDLWYPHVYEILSDPAQLNSFSQTGRWYYGPTFFPVFPAMYVLPTGEYGDVSFVPEATMDTPLVNGVAYPTTDVEPTTYRLRILNASNDRVLTFNLFQGHSTVTLADGRTVSNPVLDASGKPIDSEVNMVPAVPQGPGTVCAPGQTRPTLLDPTTGQFCVPETWPVDSRNGGMADPKDVGPVLYQVANEGGWLPSVATIDPTPVVYLLDKGRITILNIDSPALILAPGERADVVVDFSQYAGKTLLAYSDTGAPEPGADPRNSYFTGVGDQSGAGGAEDTLPGFGPNNRTMMQFKVKPVLTSTGAAPTATDAFDPTNLQKAVTAAYVATQDVPVVAQPDYQAAFPGMSTVPSMQAYAPIYLGSLKQPTFQFVPGSPSGAFNSVQVTSGGTGYLTAPTVTFTPNASDKAAAGASAQATLKIDKLVLTNAGSGYTAAPTIDIVAIAGGGNGALATATLAPNAATVTAAGTGYTSAPTVVFPSPPPGAVKPVVTATVSGGKVTGFTVVTPGSGYTAVPTMTLTGGGGTGARGTMTAKIDNLKLSSPYPTTDPLNMGGGGYTDMTQVSITFTGGSGTGAAAAAVGTVLDITLTNSGSGYLSPPTVTLSAPPAPAALPVDVRTGAAASKTATAAVDKDPNNPVTKGATLGSILAQSKAIQELFDATYGRYNNTLGLELPFSAAFNQTTIPLGFMDVTTERISNGETQLWKIVHNGLFTQSIHFRQSNVQVLNRVGWDNYNTLPAPYEFGWKDTVRVNPLEDTIVAVRPKKPVLPGFGLPVSIRANDPTQPLGSPYGFTQVNPFSNLNANIVNQMENFGWEYAWHSTNLSRLENDFMRVVVYDPKDVAPAAPVNPTATLNGNTVTVNWTDATPATMASPAAEIGFRVQRSVNGQAFADLTSDLHTVKGAFGQVNTLANATRYDDVIDVTKLNVNNAAPTPSAPTVTVTQTGNKSTSVALKWTVPAATATVPAAAGFNVVRAEVLNGVVGTFAQVNTAILAANATTYTDTTALPGTVYQYKIVALSGTGKVTLSYRVAAVNALGEALTTTTASVDYPVSTVQVPSNASTSTTVPMYLPTLGSPAVTLGMTTNGTTKSYQGTLNWLTTQNAKNYLVKVYTSTSATAPSAAQWSALTATSVDAAQSSLTATILAPTSYVTFQIVAVSNSGISSTAVTGATTQVAVPGAPTNLAFSTPTISSLTLGWAAVTGASSYTVDVSTTSGFTAGSFTTATVTTTSYLATGLSANTQYFFRVSAVNAVGASAATATTTATTNRYTLPNAAGTPSASAVATTSFTLNWTASNPGGAASYKVEVANNANFTSPASATTTSLTTPVTGLTANTTYYSRVTALNALNAAGAASGTLTTLTLPVAPAVTAVNGLTTDGATISAAVNFTSVTGLTYDVQYRDAGKNILGGNAPGNGTWTTVTGVTANKQFTVGGVKRVLEVQIRANNASGASAWSGSVYPTAQ